MESKSRNLELKSLVEKGLAGGTDGESEPVSRFSDCLPADAAVDSLAFQSLQSLSQIIQFQKGSGEKMPVTEGRVEAPPAPAKNDSNLLRVLLVDDNARVLGFLVSAFKANHCEATAASTAEQALDFLSDQSFDLVVSDIKMPGLSGLDLLRGVKGKRPGTPVVLITGVPSVDSAVFGLRYGAYDYLPKPFSFKEVRELVARLRDDRQKGNGQLSCPAGLTAELARRQSGVEALFRIGELALQGLELATFLDTVLDYTLQIIRSDAALILLREQQDFRLSQKGKPALINKLTSLLYNSFEELVKAGGEETFTLTGKESFTALAALVPGVGKGAGIFCLARDKEGAFLPDEKELLLGYARTTALALQKILLRENLESHLVDTISSFVTALESKDTYLKGHSARVSLYAGQIATTMGIPPAQVLVTRRTGMLHDVGKLVILDSILRKPAQLTKKEYALIQCHPLVAYKILRPLRFLAQEAQGAKHHHERFDGTGYPDGLKGEEIPLPARIVSVADAFDAMTSRRPYRNPIPLESAVKEICRGAKAQFDPKVTAAFASIPQSRLSEISQYQAAPEDSFPERSSHVFADRPLASPQPKAVLK